MKEPTIEEVLELVSFDRDENGRLRIYNVLGDVRGNLYGGVRGNLYGSVHGSVRGNVGGDVEGKVYGIILNK